MAAGVALLGAFVTPAAAADAQTREHVKQQLVQIQYAPGVVDEVDDGQLVEMALVLSTRDPAYEKRAWIDRIVEERQ
jgi:hypothetical protein